MKKYPEKTIQVPRFREENGFYTTKERSKLMGKIKSKDTKPEIMFRKALWAKGYHYRKNAKKLPGKPDVVLNKSKLAVFIDGEFWHGYNWEEKKKTIKSNRAFLIPKIERNMQRDKEVEIELIKLGFTVFRFWEQQIKKELETCLSEVIEHIETHK